MHASARELAIKAKQQGILARKARGEALRAQRQREKAELIARAKTRRERELRELNDRQELMARTRKAMLKRKNAAEAEELKRVSDEADQERSKRAEGKERVAREMKQERDVEAALRAQQRANAAAADSAARTQAAHAAEKAREKASFDHLDMLKHANDAIRRKRESLAVRNHQWRCNAEYKRSARDRGRKMEQEASIVRQHEAVDVATYESSLREARRQSLQHRGAERRRHAALDKEAAAAAQAEFSSLVDDRAAALEAKGAYDRACGEEERSDLRLRAADAAKRREKEDEEKEAAKATHESSEELSREDRAAVSAYESSLREARRQSLQHRGAECRRHAALDKEAAVAARAEFSSLVDDRAAALEAKGDVTKAFFVAEKENLARLAVDHQADRCLKEKVRQNSVAKESEAFLEYRLYSQALNDAKEAAKGAADDYLAWKRAQVETDRMHSELQAGRVLEAKEMELIFKRWNREDSSAEKEENKARAKFELEMASRAAGIACLHTEFEARKAAEAASKLRADRMADRASVLAHRAQGAVG